MGKPELLAKPLLIRRPTAPTVGQAVTAMPPRPDEMGVLRKPDPPTMRVLERINPPKAPSMVVEIVEEEAGAGEAADDDDKKKGGKGKRKGRREKVTAEMKRKAREERAKERDVKARKARREREEIFEVGDGGMSLEDLADAIQVDPSDIVRSLFMKGIMLSMNQVLDKNTVKLVAQEYELLVVDKEEETVTDSAKKRNDFIVEDDLDHLVARPPVVTVMGHVDHGKTSLLDYIRKTRVAAGEAGGITQGIGAYNVQVEVEGETRGICFLDTPGHEAFSAMRARGARVTDIAVIIVAADDGVQPQTREAVSHAQAAEVPIVVAINKIDKPGADVEKTKQGLLDMNLVPEEWGGSTPMVAISAKKGTGVDELLQVLLFEAEAKQLMANPVRAAVGTVIEAHLDRRRGAVSTMLVQAGTLRVGDLVRAGACVGKVRSLTNDRGQSITEATPSVAAQVVGLNTVPQAGDEFQVYTSEADARRDAQLQEEALRQQHFADMTGGSMVTLSSLATIDEDSEALQRLNIVIKGDTSGVVEAIKSALGALPQDMVALRYLLAAAGDITSSDIDLAAASGAMIIGFNLSPDETTLAYAKRLGVLVSTYKVIYNLIDDVKAAMQGRLRQVEEKQVLGLAEVRGVFGSGKTRVAGGLVTEGKLVKGAQVTVKRGNEVLHTGPLTSLRRVKDDVSEVLMGVECGFGTEGFTGWNLGDKLECFAMVAKSRRLEDVKATTVVDVATLA